MLNLRKISILDTDIPQWQKDINDVRLAEYNNNPDNVLDWDDVLKELNAEDKPTSKP